MALINLTADVTAATKHLTLIQQKQIPFATSVAINNTAKLAQGGIRAAIARSFDRPTPYTLGGTFVRRSNRLDLTAEVGLIDKPKGANRAPVKWLGTQITGGSRENTAFELALRSLGALPSGWKAYPADRVRLNRYGNISRKLISEIIGSLRSGFRVAAGRGKNLHFRGYFAALPGAANTAHLHPGLYLRVDRGAKAATRRKGAVSASSGLQPVLLYKPELRYRKRLDILKPVSQVVRQNFSAEMDKALRLALSTAR